MSKFWCMAMAVVLLVGFEAQAGEEQPIEMSRVPARVRAAAQDAAKSVIFRQAAMEHEAGQVVYELKGKDSEGRQIEVDVTADGQVLEIETQVSASELPSVVVLTVKKHLDGFKPTFLEKSVRPWKSVWYELEGQYKNDRLDVEVRADGLQILIETNDDVDFSSDETEVAMSEVPDQALKAAKKAAGSVTLTRAATEEEDGELVYELQGKNKDGKIIEVDVTADGQVLEIETEIDESDLPSQVRKTLTKCSKGFKPEFVEKSVRPYKSGNGQETWYEFEGTSQDGSRLDLEISEDGRRLLIEDDDIDVRVASSQRKNKPN